MFKKILAFVLTLTLVLSMAACGAPSNVRGEVNSDSKQPTEKVEEEFEVGSSTGNTYKNKFIGIQCALGSDWVFKTDAEMMEVNQATADMVGDAYKDALASLDIVYDMMATNANQMDTVGVILEKQSVTGMLMTEEQYLDAAKDGAVDGLQSMGMNITSAEIGSIQFAGKQHASLTIEGTFSGVAVYETMVVIKCNGYIACVTVCTWMQNTCMDVLNQFQAY